MTKRIWMVLAALICLGAVGSPGTAQQTGADMGPRCAALATADFSRIPDAPTQITASTAVDAASWAPSHCSVKGVIDQHIKFEMLLPAIWNGKFMEVGCGGTCGVVVSGPCAQYISRGYACIASDMGHTGNMVDMKWAKDNLPAQFDFGFRATHLAALTGKAVAAAFYKAPVSRSYYFGCSTGGYQGVMEAQRFPWDFNGIVAGAPDIDETQANFRALWLAKVRHDAAGKPVLGKTELTLLHNAALDKCDMDDGVKDGIIGDARHCRVDPKALLCKAGQTSGCLTAQQVQVAEDFYSGPVDSKGRPTSTGSYLPGSELGWGNEWPSGGLEDYFRYGLAGYSTDPNWTLANFDFDHDFERFGLGPQYDNTNPDLRKLRDAGGKMIVYHGGSDETDPPGPMIDYYETVEKTMGGRRNTQQFFRLFMIPGMNHCSGGPGDMRVDWMSVMEDWVERGKAPDAIVGEHKGATPAASFTRPLYPYPQFAKYKGHGDPNKAENFRAVLPK